ncbi:uncharacterized protein B0T23DRAFT_323515, partial [Neurospora hispaniola]
KIKLEIFRKIDNTSKLDTIQIREISTIVREDFPSSIYTRTDSYNPRARIRHRNLNNNTPTNTLIKSFNNNNIKYIKKIDLEDNERLLGLIFTFPTYINIARIFPEVIIINNMYNTNHFYYPFY